MQKETVEFILLSGGDDEIKKTNVALFHTNKKLDFQKLPHPIRMTSIEDDQNETKPIKSIHPLQKRNKWRICDGEGKNNYEGVLEGGQTAKYIMLTKDGPYFRVTPIKDWYKFRYIVPKNDENNETDIENIISKEQSKRKDKLSLLLGKKKDDETVDQVSELTIYGEYGDDDEIGDVDIDKEKEIAEELDYDDENPDDVDVYEIKDIEKSYSKKGKELNKILRKHGVDIDYVDDEEEEELEEEEEKKKPVTTTTTVISKDQKLSTKKRKSPDVNDKDKDMVKKQKLIEQTEEIKRLETEIFDVTRRQLQVRSSISGRELLMYIKNHFGQKFDENIKIAIKSVISKRLTKNERDEYVLKNNTYP